MENKGKASLSIIIITKNEARQIRECIETVCGWADEIVIVDDESTDNTRAIASEYTDKVFINKMTIEGKQRNFGASKAKHEWVMMLDADERMTNELKIEIEATLAANNGKVVAYWVPRKNYLADHWLQYGGWYPGTHIKMYNKNYLVWKEDSSEVVHPGVTLTKGYKGAKLKQNLIHYNFKNIDDYMAKVNRQTTLEAIKWHLQDRNVTLLSSFRKSFDRFCRRYIRKRGYRDGFYGFAASVLSGFYQFAAYCKYWEIKKKGMYITKKNQGDKAA